MIDPFLQPLDVLHDLLVREFRAWQALYDSIWSEHSALVLGQVSELPEISIVKEHSLGEIKRLKVARREALRAINSLPETGWSEGNTFSLEQVRATSDPERERRLECLLAGIQVLMGQVREWTCINRAYASVALAQISTTQDDLPRRHRLGAYQALLQVSSQVLTGG